MNSKTRKLTFTALLFAITLVLGIVESLLPPLFTTVQGVKMGLGNIGVMYALIFINPLTALSLAVLKGLFAFITRGLTAGLLSLCGSVLSVAAMTLVLKFTKNPSYTLLSMVGGLSHNIGQFAVISAIYAGVNMVFYLPVLLISGCIFGFLTAILLKGVLPAMKKFDTGGKGE